MTLTDTLQVTVDPASGDVLSAGIVEFVDEAAAVAAATAAANAYTDARIESLPGGPTLAPVRCAATSNYAGTYPFTGLPGVFDDVTVADGDRVMLPLQTSASRNGIWIASTGAWTRPADYTGPVPSGKTVEVLAGTANALTTWEVTGSGTIGTNTTTWTKLHASLVTVDDLAAETARAESVYPHLLLPEAHGAVGDGITDDTAAVVATFAALTSGQTLWLGAGKKYLVKETSAFTPVATISTSGVTVAGSGTLLLDAASHADAWILNLAADDVTIDGVTFDGNSVSRNVPILVTNALRPTIQRVRFFDPGSGAVNVGSGVFDLSVDGCAVYGGAYGVTVSDPVTGGRYKITNNMFMLSTVTGNAINVDAPTHGVSHVTIVGNSVYSYPGTPPVQGLGVGLANVTHATVTGNTIADCQTGIHMENGCQYVTITGNTVFDCLYSGIEIVPETPSTVPCRNITITGNVVSNCCQTSPSVDGQGRSMGGIQVSASSADGPHAQGITITGNISSGNGASGIYCYQGFGVSILGNVCENNTTHGISLVSVNGIVDGNTCTDTQTTKTQQYGLNISGAGYPTKVLTVGINYLDGNLTGTINDVTTGHLTLSQLATSGAVWAASTAFLPYQSVLLPTGGRAYVTTPRTSRASFDATERAAWTFLPGGHYEQFTTSGTWVRPTGITGIRVRGKGAGSGGHGGGSALTSGGVSAQVGGPGGGAGSTFDQAMTPAANLTVTVGTGGTGGTGAAVNGNPGGAPTAGANTIVTDGTITLTAQGGSFGTAPAGNSTAAVQGGIPGGAANLATSVSMIPGCGGTAANTAGLDAVPLREMTGGGAGAPASATFGGAGGNVAAGPGQRAARTSALTGTTTGGNGATPTVPGHGGAGGGGGAPGGAGGNGANGANGIVEIWY